jgi:VCBS repeat-containing protein
VTIQDSRGGERTDSVTINVVDPSISTDITFTGASQAYEDNPTRDPEGQVTLAATRGTNYTLYVGETAITDDDTEVELSYGTLTVDEDGRWSYELDNTNPVVNDLDGDSDDSDGAVGTLQESVSIMYFRVTNAFTGATERVNSVLNITINGATDYVSSPNFNTDLTDDISLTLDPVLLAYMNARPSVNFAVPSIRDGRGDDVVRGTDRVDSMNVGYGDDWLFGYGEDDHFHITTGRGSDVIDGGDGDDSLYITISGGWNLNLSRIMSTIETVVDSRWKFDGYSQSWVSGNTAEHTYRRIWIDSDKDGVLENSDEFHYFTDVEKLSLEGSNGNDILYGVAEENYFEVLGGNDVIIGGDGSDKYKFSADAYNGVYTTDGNIKVGYSIHLDLQDTTRWKQNADGGWTSGSGREYTFIRAWHDLDDDGVEDDSDQYDYMSDIESITLALSNGRKNTITGGEEEDFIQGAITGTSIIDGAEGHDGFGMFVEVQANLSFDAESATKWKNDSVDGWISGTSSDFTYHRLWIDLDNDGVDDATDGYSYIKNFEYYYFFGNNSYMRERVDHLAGSEGNDTFYSASGNDILKGRGGDDHLDAGSGDDILSGGSGTDILKGGRGNDIFVLYQGSHNQGVTNRDEVLDFTNYAGVFGFDRIRVDTTSGNESTLAALKSAANLRWTQDSDYDYDGGTRHTDNNSQRNDTIIYATQGTLNNLEDDIVLMVLQDYSKALSIADFDIV